jgi:hypothetical protein
MGWAKFWAIFSQTHLATLVRIDILRNKHMKKKLFFWSELNFFMPPIHLKHKSICTTYIGTINKELNPCM